MRTTTSHRFSASDHTSDRAAVLSTVNALRSRDDSAIPAANRSLRLRVPNERGAHASGQLEILTIGTVTLCCCIRQVGELSVVPEVVGRPHPLAMNQSVNNPTANVLKAGVTDQQLEDALARSGYPLQTIVATGLRDRMAVEQEWSFKDRDTGELRALDIRAHKSFDDANAAKSRVRPHLDLLIECKQSELPFVFFLSPDKPWRSECPLLAGLHHYDIELHTDDDRSTWTVDIRHALSMDNHPFLVSAVPHCSTFSKVIRRGGKELELSGTEAYQGIMLPLVKALSHLRDEEAPPTTAVYHDLHMGLSVAVLDAPMVGVEVGQESNRLEMLPWIRVIRQEYVDGVHTFRRARVFAIDVVHRDFLTSYVDQHAMPFAKEFADRAVRHDKEIASGLGFVSGLGKDSRSDLEQRVRPASKLTKRRHA